jgi:ethanolamine ammonia-lyase large subunit
MLHDSMMVTPEDEGTARHWCDASRQPRRAEVTLPRQDRSTRASSGFGGNDHDRLAAAARRDHLPYAHSIGGTRYSFADLRTLLARATPFRSGDVLAGIAAASGAERVAAQMALADLPLQTLLDEPVVPYETDEVTRLIHDQHDRAAFAAIASLTVGAFREFLLQADPPALTALRRGLTPEIAAAVSKIMKLQDLVAVAAKCRVVTKFRNTIGLPGRLSVRLQPNHPTDDPRGVAASTLDGLLLGAGDAVIGVNPATDNVDATCTLLAMLDTVRDRYAIPTQTCVLSHVTTSLRCIERGAPVDLVFQSIAGTEAANRSFGVSLSLLKEAREAALSLGRGTLGDNVMYFETGQGSALSADAHHGVDQQTLEARTYAVARAFEPLLVNTVVGFIGPEYLYDGKQITRAGLEDHFCGKLLGLPMGVDVCYTNHAEADQDDMDSLLTLLGVAGVTYVMGVPGADDVMLSYQSTSFHDALYLRAALNLRPAPEFESWLSSLGIDHGTPDRLPEALAPALIGLG